MFVRFYMTFIMLQVEIVEHFQTQHFYKIEHTASDQKVENLFFRHHHQKTHFPVLRSGAASVCLLSMTCVLGASRLGLFIFEVHAHAFGGIGIPFLLGAPL